jgi:hypothetical protein
VRKFIAIPLGLMTPAKRRQNAFGLLAGRDPRFGKITQLIGACKLKFDPTSPCGSQQFHPAGFAR